MSTPKLSHSSPLGKPKATLRRRARLLSTIQAAARIGELPANFSRWDMLLQGTVVVIVALLFVALAAGPALQRYLKAKGLADLPFTGLARPSVESFIAVGLVILMAMVLSRFPWFLYASFQTTKKARIRGDIWTDLLALGYGMKLRLSGTAEQILTEFEANELKERYGAPASAAYAAPWPAATPAAGGGNGLGHAPVPDIVVWPLTPPAADGQQPLADAAAAAVEPPVAVAVSAPDPGQPAADLPRSPSSGGSAAEGAAGPNEVALRVFTRRFEDSYGYAPFRGPLWSVTVFYLIGWLMVLLPNGLTANAGGATGMGGLAAVISGGISGYIGQVLANMTAVSAAFLGAYSFSMMSLFRRYLRSDFKPTAITQASVRIVVAWIAGFLLSFAAIDLVPAFRSRGLLLMVAFFLGVFSLNALTILWDLLAKTVPTLAHFGQGLKSSALTDLDGLDAWHEDRLGEAGIDSVRGLANADFLDLLIGVRMPTQTLVDWVDQALLRIHVSESDWRFLMNHTSIRTATDMLDFLGQPDGKEQLGAVAAQTKETHDGLAPADIDMLHDTLGREPNAARIAKYQTIQKRIAEGAELFPPAWWTA